MASFSNVIAIDGLAGAGKGTASKAVAKRLGFEVLDSGSIYRAATLIWDHGTESIDVDRITIENRKLRLDGVLVTDEHIRTRTVDEKVFHLAAIGPIRRQLRPLQRGFLSNDIGLVAEGRDMTSVVFTDAKLKIFMTASPEVRAKRRVAEYHQKGQIDAEYNRVLANLLERDELDANRLEYPMIKVSDAHLIDTTDMTQDEVVAEIICLWQKATSM
jgi:cytidylate kinase